MQRSVVRADTCDAPRGCMPLAAWFCGQSRHIALKARSKAFSPLWPPVSHYRSRLTSFPFFLKKE